MGWDMNLSKLWRNIQEFCADAVSPVLVGAVGNGAQDMLKLVGEALIGRATVPIGVRAKYSFFGMIPVETFSSQLEHFKKTVLELDSTNTHLYKSVVESNYPNIRRGLDECKKVISSLHEIEISDGIELYKANLMKIFDAIKKVCDKIMKTEEFEEFKLESIKKFIEGSIEKTSNKAIKDKLGEIAAGFGSLVEQGFGTFMDYIKVMYDLLEKSYDNLQKNNEKECVIYFYNGKWNIIFEKLGINKICINEDSSTGYITNMEHLLREKINNNNKTQAKKYGKCVTEKFKSCVEIHDDIKKLYYKVLRLYENLRLECLKITKDELKKVLDDAHLLVFGSVKCWCGEYSNVEDGANILDKNVVYASASMEPFRKFENSSHVSGEYVDTTVARKCWISIKDLFELIKPLKPKALKWYKEAIKIEKEYKNKMGKIEKLIVKCKGVRYRLVDKKVWEFYRNFDSKITQAENLGDLTNALNECIERLETINKFKKEILSKYMALEKRVNKLKLEGNIGEDKFKNFNKLKEELEKLNLREDINFSNFKKSLNEAEKEVKKLEQLCKKQAKQREKGKPTNDENRLPLIPV